MKTLVHFIREDQGQDIIEYALLAAFISVIAILAVSAIGLDVNRLFTSVDTTLGG